MALNGTDLERVLISPNVSDANLEPANVVDVLDRIADKIDTVFTDQFGGSLADAVVDLASVFTSPREECSNGVPANIVDVLGGICREADSIGSGAGHIVAMSIREGSTEIARAIDFTAVDDLAKQVGRVADALFAIAETMKGKP